MALEHSPGVPAPLDPADERHRCARQPASLADSASVSQGSMGSNSGYQRFLAVSVGSPKGNPNQASVSQPASNTRTRLPLPLLHVPPLGGGTLPV
eukprot:8107492-Alexandrium_andersonii.AAC.1